MYSKTVTHVVRQLSWNCWVRRCSYSPVKFDNVELLHKDETTSDVINKILSREREKNPNFEDAFHVTDLGEVCRKMDTWRHHLPRVEPFYAVKCNDDMNILSTFVKLGASFDCASKDEISKVLHLGVPPSKIVYAHPVKQHDHLRYAAERDVSLMTFDSEDELHKIKSIYPAASLLLRIRPPSEYYDVHESPQFGCHIWEVPSLLSAAKNLNLNIIGACFHSGSGFMNGRVYEEMLKLSDQVFAMATTEGFSMTFLDIGGGFWGNNKPPVQFAEIALQLNQSLDMYFPPDRGVRIISEPGRYFMASAVTLAAPVIGKKIIPQCKESDYPSRNCSRMYFLNDGRYGIFHNIWYTTCHVRKPEVLKPPANKELLGSSVWGPSLSTGDCIFKDCQLPDLEVGDWLYVQNMGAYTLTLHRGNIKFNGIESPRKYYVCCRSLWNELNSC